MTSHQYSNLVNTINSLENKGSIKDFLFGILSPKELEDISNRLEIIKRLKAGQNQHDIAKSLGVGVATVSRGAKEIKNGRFKYID